jgi:Flp pilus assembly protein TadD
MSTGFVRSPISSRSPWHPGTLSMVLLSLVVATGCRSCGADKKASAKKKSEKVVKKKPPGKPVSDMAAESSPKADLQKLPLKSPTAEDAREVAAEVATARDSILKGDKASAEQGRSQLVEFVKTHDTDADAHYWLGRSWLVETVAVPAIDELSLAVQHDGEFIGARQWLAVALHREKRCADAVVHLDKVKQARPEDLDALYNHAVCKAAVSDWDTAFAEFEEYCGKKSEDFCATVPKAKKMHQNATGERRLPTEEEKEEFRRKKEAGELPPEREAFRKQVQGG